MICVTLHKKADGREDDREATFQLFEEVQNSPDLWDVSSAANKDTKNKQKNGRTSGEMGVIFDASLTCEGTSLPTF